MGIIEDVSQSTINIKILKNCDGGPLMRDQVAKYSGSGLACAFVGEEQRDENVKEAVVRGQFQLIYMSP